MRFVRDLSLMTVAILTSISAVAHPTKGDLRGRWVMKSATCSGGQELASLKGVKGSLTYDGKTLRLGMTDPRGKNQDAFSSDTFVLQEDLLTVPTSNGTSTMKLQMGGKSSLVLKLPVVGLGKDCPSETELQILAFERLRL